MWETCMTINNTWAYNIHDREYKSSQFLIRALVEVASRGGNFLLNVGQQPDGVIPENTRPETLMQAAEIGKTAGLRYVAWSATGRTRVA